MTKKRTAHPTRQVNAPQENLLGGPDLVHAFRMGNAEIEICKPSFAAPGELSFVVRTLDGTGQFCSFQLDDLGSLAKIIDITLWWYYGKSDPT